MNLTSFDISSVFIYVLPAAFWIAVLYQWVRKQQQISGIREREKCPRCKKDDLEIELHVVNKRNNHKVSLLKNIWGGMMLLSLAYILLRVFAIILIDLIAGSNITGIQNESLLGKVGVSSFPLIVGLACTIYGIPLLLDYFVGNKATVVNITCNECRTAYVLE
jgi:hypothetical protein